MAFWSAWAPLVCRPSIFAAAALYWCASVRDASPCDFNALLSAAGAAPLDAVGAADGVVVADVVGVLESRAAAGVVVAGGVRSAARTGLASRFSAAPASSTTAAA